MRVGGGSNTSTQVGVSIRFCALIHFTYSQLLIALLLIMIRFI